MGQMVYNYERVVKGLGRMTIKGLPVRIQFRR